MPVDIYYGMNSAVLAVVRLLLTDPRLAMAMYFGLTTPSQYRLVGPGAWSGARDAILSSSERMMQPLKTCQPRVAMATTPDNGTPARAGLKMLVLPAAAAGIVCAAAATVAWMCSPTTANTRLSFFR